MILKVLSLALCLSLALPAKSMAAPPDLQPPLETAGGAGQSIEERATHSTAHETVPAAQSFSEEEEAALEARAEEPGPEVAGGALSNLHLTYIVIALGAIVLAILLID